MTLPLAAALLALVAAQGVVQDGDVGEQAGRRRNTLYDLVAHMHRAEPSDDNLHAVSRHGFASGTDPREHVTFLRTRPGTSIVFADLITNGNAQLEFEIGSALPTPVAQLGAGAVRFTVDTRSDADSDWHQVFNHVVATADLPADRGLIAKRILLPGDGRLSRSLRLGAHAVDGDGQWAGWNTPMLRSDGDPLPLASDLLRVPGAGRDLLAELDQAELRGEASASLRSVDPAPGVRNIGGPRPSLRLDAPARATWTLRLPEDDPKLSVRLGVDGLTSWQMGGGEVAIAVQIDGRPVHTLTLDPARRARDQGWKRFEVDLAPWAGQRVALGLVVTPGEHPGADVVGVSSLRIPDVRGVDRLASTEAPTVVLIVADTTRLDALGPASPQLTSLAARGQRFTAARSTSSWTWPATASLMTGLDPVDHGVLDATRSVLPDHLTTLAETLAQRGWTTAGFSANELISPLARFDQGFETFVVTPQARARSLNDRVSRWLDETPGVARFLYLHYMDPHAPYLPPSDLEDVRLPIQGAAAAMDAFAAALTQGPSHPDTRARIDALRAAYNGEVVTLDRAIGELLDLLREHGALDDALVVFVADHGEEFMEHGLVGHGWHLFDETLAVPLVMTGFGDSALTPGVIRRPVTTRDVMPSLLEHLGIDRPPALAAPFTREPAGRPAPLFAQTFIAKQPGNDASFELSCVVHGGFKLVLRPDTDEQRLYDLSADPAELVDLAPRPEQARRVAELRALLDVWRSRADDVTVVGSSEQLDEARRLLEELGYIGR